jgi:glycosyltransferase involved in cell wall biosynthesis
MTPPECPLTVLHVITDLEVGGAESMLTKLALAPGQDDIRHAVVSLIGKGVHGPALEDGGVPVTALGMTRGRPSLGALARLSGILRTMRPDVIMTWLYHADLLGSLCARLIPGTPLLWNIRCADMDLSRYGRVTRMLPRVLARLSRQPVAVMANSLAGQRLHESLGYRPRRWLFMPNGFDAGLFRPDAGARARLRGELGVPEAAPLIGLIARVDPMKDHGTFLRAAAGVTARWPEARILMAGQGTDDPALLDGLDLPRDRVFGLGRRSDVAALSAALDVAVSSSLTEGFSNTLGEAMSCGVPCVVTDVGDSALIVGESGVVVPKADPAALAHGIEKLLALPAADRQALGMAARRRVEETFSLDAVVARYRQAVLAAAGRAAWPE